MKWIGCEINTRKKLLTISSGDVGTYDYTKMHSCEVVYKQNNKDKLIRENDLRLCTWGNLNVKVVVRVELEKEEFVCINISEKETQWKSLQFHQDYREAMKIVNLLKKSKSNFTFPN